MGFRGEKEILDYWMEICGCVFLYTSARDICMEKEI